MRWHGCRLAEVVVGPVVVVGWGKVYLPPPDLPNEEAQIGFKWERRMNTIFDHFRDISRVFVR